MLCRLRFASYGPRMGMGDGTWVKLLGVPSAISINLRWPMLYFFRKILVKPQSFGRAVALPGLH